MKLLIIALLIAILFLVFCLPSIIRAYARIRADQITHGHRPGTEKRINMYISILTWSNNWITNNEGPDNQRINLLRNMLNEMQNPHG